MAIKTIQLGAAIKGRFLKTAGLVLIFWSLFLSMANAYPYGITPSGANPSDATTAYNSFKSTYFTNDCGATYERVRNDPGSTATVSEGMGYGMLMVAYLEPDATGPALMRDLLNFVNKNLDPRGLMNWNVNCGGANNTYSATDGDLDIAFALIKAEGRWPGNGFGTAASTFLTSILTYETDSCGVGPGDAPGFTTCSGYTYPSYFATSYFTTFKCFTGNTNWDTVKTNAYNQLAYWYANYKLPPEQINMTGGTWNSGDYQYNSCRVPWRLSLDYLWNANTTAQNQCQKIVNNFMSTDPSPSTIGDDYSYSTGAKTMSNHNAAFTGPAGDGAMVGAANQSWLNSEYANLAGLSMGTLYYQDAHKVLSLMVQTGLFTDVCGLGTATPTPTVGSPTATFTMTTTPTVTPTGTAIVGCPVTLYNGDTAGTNLSAGSSWVSNAVVSEVGTSPHSGTNCMQMAYNWPAGTYYAGVGWNWTHYSAASPKVVDLTKMSILELWLRATTGAPVTGMTVVLADTSSHDSAPVTVDNYLPGGVTGSWQVVDIPTSAFVPVSTFTNTAMWEIDLATGLGMSSGTQTVFMDDFVFYGPCPTNTPTPTQTFTSTATYTKSNTPTPTFSPTPSFTGTPTNTFSATPSFTATLSPTATYTGQPTSTFTSTFAATATPTNTFTGQPTATSTFTNTLVWTSTPTNTPMNTPTNSLTPTSTPGAATSTPTPGLNIIISDPYPNPTGKWPVGLDIQGQGITLVKWDVFTAAFRKIRSQNPAPSNSHISWELTDKFGNLVASGIYYLRVEVDSRLEKKIAVKKILVLR